MKVERAHATAEEPTAIFLAGRRVPVAAIIDAWLVEDEWWRAPIARYYVQALLADERLLTFFHDRIGGEWYTQRYPGVRDE